MNLIICPSDCIYEQNGYCGLDCAWRISDYRCKEHCPHYRQREYELLLPPRSYETTFQREDLRLV